MSTDREFTEFYLATYRRLVGQLFVLTGNRHDAEELAQEAFSRALPRWTKISGYDAPEAWVRRVAFNLAFSRRRKALRGAAALLRLGGDRFHDGDSSDGVAVAEALRAVPVRHRQALVLHYVVDLSVREVAVELGVPENTVKTWLRRGRQQLHAALRVDETTGTEDLLAHLRP
ncbi:sigma factor-like helix-turn-helix DNA-binding protein [Micromonospora sp. WMMA1998]|uniref:RNA polymerase sigma factor n=1 Tax=Micromonospora sp. WMMA1998 TaxID=3015167 RepID=UPI00248AA0BE|nr:sigma factor-like helix-turn-helix DNA-binding protein [Micromonospora sp. WMMA1998]WBC16727.1 sigma factor-like helix-turn-helix DNA-binding protein [Micromonospora sp. WMMA1998]